MLLKIIILMSVNYEIPNTISTSRSFSLNVAVIIIF